MSDLGNGYASYDLHLHTYWSYDALAHPERYFARAQSLGVSCIAITDHHVLDSLEEVQRIARAYPNVRAIPAAELSVTTSIGAVDLLCYGFSRPFSDKLRALLDAYHAWQRAAGEAWCAGMQALGYDYTPAHRLELLRSYRPLKAMAVQGETHVRNEIQRQYFFNRGFIATAGAYAALGERLRERVPFPPYPRVEDVVPVVKRAGAVVAIAHPYRYFDGYNLSRMDALREECGLDGIECAHPSVPPEYAQRYRAYCERHGLFSVGGSDCHQEAGLERAFARHGGADAWLDEFLDRLKEQ
jgi:predicted metal-dependent phosphoesterase TrpH